MFSKNNSGPLKTKKPLKKTSITKPKKNKDIELNKIQSNTLATEIIKDDLKKPNTKFVNNLIKIADNLDINITNTDLIQLRELNEFINTYKVKDIFLELIENTEHTLTELSKLCRVEVWVFFEHLRWYLLNADEYKTNFLDKELLNTPLTLATLKDNIATRHHKVSVESVLAYIGNILYNRKK